MYVGNSDEAKSVLHRPSVLETITFLNGGKIVNTAINFDQKACAHVCEIEDMGTKRRLATKVMAFDPAQHLPEALFSRRW